MCFVFIWTEFLFKYRETKHQWLNAVRKSKIFNKVVLLLAGLSPSILRMRVYNPLNVAWKVWVYPPFDENQENQKNFISSKWCQIGYDFPKETLSKETFLEETSPYISNRFQDLAALLDKYDKLSPQDQDKFLKACYWFHQGLIDSSITSRFLNFVIMVEGLLPNDSVICETCKRPKYEVRQKFRDFLMRYVGEEYKSLASKMYDMRSSIAHSSLTLAGEGSSDFSVGLIPNDIGQRDIVWKMSEMCGFALVNWLIEQSVE